MFLCQKMCFRKRKIVFGVGNECLATEIGFWCRKCVFGAGRGENKTCDIRVRRLSLEFSPFYSSVVLGPPKAKFLAPDLFFNRKYVFSNENRFLAPKMCFW